MWLTALIPFILQGICMIFDEGYFHLRRGLPKWERIGHPLDTLTVLLCQLWVLFIPYSTLTLKIYVGLSLFSCLFVTKDEFVHKEHCPAAEGWLHAVLFTLHPLSLILLGFLWYRLHANLPANWIIYWLDFPFPLEYILWGELFLMGPFFLYQVFYWNVVWKEEKKMS